MQTCWIICRILRKTGLLIYGFIFHAHFAGGDLSLSLIWCPIILTTTPINNRNKCTSQREIIICQIVYFSPHQGNKCTIQFPIGGRKIRFFDYSMFEFYGIGGASIFEIVGGGGGL